LNLWWPLSIDYTKPFRSNWSHSQKETTVQAQKTKRNNSTSTKIKQKTKREQRYKHKNKQKTKRNNSTRTILSFVLFLCLYCCFFLSLVLFLCLYCCFICFLFLLVLLFLFILCACTVTALYSKIFADLQYHTEYFYTKQKTKREQRYKHKTNRNNGTSTKVKQKTKRNNSTSKQIKQKTKTALYSKIFADLQYHTEYFYTPISAIYSRISSNLGSQRSYNTQRNIRLSNTNPLSTRENQVFRKSRQFLLH
jgi:predicted membrane metal-binding protein